MQPRRFFSLISWLQLMLVNPTQPNRIIRRISDTFVCLPVNLRQCQILYCSYFSRLKSVTNKYVVFETQNRKTLLDNFRCISPTLLGCFDQSFRFFDFLCQFLSIISWFLKTCVSFKYSEQLPNFLAKFSFIRYYLCETFS